MRALIFAQPESPRAAQFEVAGQSVLVRQLQWLRDNGITHVVIELAGAQPDALRRWLLGDDPLLHDCTLLPSAQPCGVRQLALRAGLADDEPFLALPANLLSHGTLPDPLPESSYE